jgi:hypothetical protein
MTAMFLGALFIAGVLAAAASLLVSVGRYGKAALALPGQLRSCRTRDDIRFRVRAPIVGIVSDRRVLRPAPRQRAA